MAGCGGTRITHLDGEVAACTHELLGRPCDGGHHLAATTCEVVLGSGGCEHCEVVFHAEQLVRAASAEGRQGAPVRGSIARR